MNGPHHAFGHEPDITIQDIIQQWAAIERPLIETGLSGGQAEAGFIDEVDAFRGSVQSFLNSEKYRIYRLAPLTPAAKFVFGPSAPNEMPEIHAAAGLTGAFLDAVSDNDREKAVLVSRAIQDNLVRALLRDTEAERFAGAAFYRLILVFTGFIILTALVIWFLYKALIRSLRLGAESSHFSRALLLAQEAERSRLSRELHDTIAQDLRYLSLNMSKIGLCADTGAREKLCNDAAALQSELIRKVRDICDFLVPPDFRFQGLPDALRRLCLDFGTRTGIECRTDMTENLKPFLLDEEKQLQVFRIVQEALINVEKHAGASEAIVIMHQSPDGNLSIGVSDDGKGFVPPEENTHLNNAHLGIRGMNERAAILGGSLKIKSEPGEGTLVRLELPVRNWRE